MGMNLMKTSFDSRKTVPQHIFTVLYVSWQLNYVVRSRRGPIEWPAWFPDLTPMEFFYGLQPNNTAEHSKRERGAHPTLSLTAKLVTTEIKINRAQKGLTSFRAAFVGCSRSLTAYHAWRGVDSPVALIVPVSRRILLQGRFRVRNWIYRHALVTANCIEDLGDLGTWQKLNHKRQIFREQVSPHVGGKIPEDAFRTDRLALNRLNKEGIAIPDGVLLEARHRESHHSSHRHDPAISASIVKLVQHPNGRYAPPEGHYPFENLIESTYIIRPPWGHAQSLIIPPHKTLEVPLTIPHKPLYSPDSGLGHGLSIGEEDLLTFANQLDGFYPDLPGTKVRQINCRISLQVLIAHSFIKAKNITD
ncbi:hypothetical protein J6590_041426 [Homalodisca vitripennis]|nr:hypothetical protein J6590_041426 [Homalodisca vitripennis]